MTAEEIKTEASKKILIETYWNVNYFRPLRHNSRLNINRDILECKCEYKVEAAQAKAILIETYWNVNR